MIYRKESCDNLYVHHMADLYIMDSSDIEIRGPSKVDNLMSDRSRT